MYKTVCQKFHNNGSLDYLADRISEFINYYCENHNSTLISTIPVNNDYVTLILFIFKTND